MNLDIMQYFPLDSPRPSQEKVIRAIDGAFLKKRIVILEAPVGSGKSAVALTIAKSRQSSHIITPRKSLQDQYFADFHDSLVLMKGRNAYPCTRDSGVETYRNVSNQILKGKVNPPASIFDSCAMGPCANSSSIKKRCEDAKGPCPYGLAILTAQQSDCIVHNAHSFIYQANFGEKFDKREVLIIDEAHMMEGVLRDFVTKKFELSKVVRTMPDIDRTKMSEWLNYFSSSEFVPKETRLEIEKKQRDPTYSTAKDEYMAKVDTLGSNAEFMDKNGFTVKRTPTFSGSTETGVVFEFIPHNLGNAMHNYLFDYGEKVLLMSGTIYDHDQYCRSIGIDPNDAISLRIPSSFPAKNRPVYLKKEYQTDTSFANWNANFPDLIQIIDKIQGKFPLAKGLIHAPSYDSAAEITKMVPGRRLVTHGRQDFQSKLEEFYASKEPLIFVSPICQQGVDFKDDRARFQVITRVPYLNTSDEFVEHKVKNDFNWYNYQALIIFGQMLGRPVRSESDFGATFLVDSRFHKFIDKNRNRLPKWVMDSMIYD